MIYLACPYSHPDATVRRHRFDAANRAAARLILERRQPVFSPLSHSHPIAETGLIDPHDSLWYEQDNAFVRLASRVCVLMLPGWNHSRGIAAEIALAESLDIPVEYLDAAWSKR